MLARSRTALAALLTASALTTGALATAAPASALSYKCTTSKKTIHDPSFLGAMPYDWDVTVKICAARSGSYVTTYAKIVWDGPLYADGSIFDAGAFRLYVKKSVSGPDPVKTYKTYNIKSRLEADDVWGNHNGRYTTSALRYKIGSAKGLGDGALRLDWNNDGKGVRIYQFTASPRV
ncbi:hypothetical protein OK074_4988 [Actinobacteria bacterium OK074]|nr:hypothetical protein OK074_4988 [Actinobacteria bacterium OK074]